jgi:hypothetical protein
MMLNWFQIEAHGVCSHVRLSGARAACYSPGNKKNGDF